MTSTPPETRRAIDPPAHLSPDARALFNASPTAPALPALDDRAASRRLAKALDHQILAALTSAWPHADRIEPTDLGGVPAQASRPAHPFSERVCLSFHGGAFLAGGGASAGLDALRAEEMTGLWSYAVDYRMPPDHPFPAAVDDALIAYRHVLATRRPEDIVLMGRSAGGNIAAAMVVRARDEELPLPGCLILLSPAVDLTESGDSFSTLEGQDPGLPISLAPIHVLYANGVALSDPRVSPLFSNFSKGFPPTLVQAGTRDVFLSNAVRLHRALCSGGGKAELHIWDGMPHGGFGGRTTEDVELATQVRRFVTEHTI